MNCDGFVFLYERKLVRKEMPPLFLRGSAVESPPSTLVDMYNCCKPLTGKQVVPVMSGIGCAPPDNGLAGALRWIGFHRPVQLDRASLMPDESPSVCPKLH